jgi:hypothetical protein
MIHAGELSMEFFGTLVGHQGQSLLNAVYLGCLFWIVLVWPRRLHNLLAFRLSCALYAVSLFVGVVVNVYLSSTSQMVAVRPGVQNAGYGIYLSLISPLIFLASFLLAIESVFPRLRGKLQPLSPPRKKSRPRDEDEDED